MFKTMWQCMGNGRGKPDAETKINMKTLSFNLLTEADTFGLLIAALNKSGVPYTLSNAGEHVTVYISNGY